MRSPTELTEPVLRKSEPHAVSGVRGHAWGDDRGRSFHRLGLPRSEEMRDSKVFSIVAVLGALAVMQVSADAAWAAKKPRHEKHEKKEKKEDKDKDKKEDKNKKEEKDKREINNCPGGLSKGCSPGACRCPDGPEKEKKPKNTEDKEKKPKKAEGKEKKPKKAEPGRRTQTPKGAEPARRMRSSSNPLSSFVIRYDKGADALDRRPQLKACLL